MASTSQLLKDRQHRPLGSYSNPSTDVRESNMSASLPSSSSTVRSRGSSWGLVSNSSVRIGGSLKNGTPDSDAGLTSGTTGRHAPPNVLADPFSLGGSAHISPASCTPSSSDHTTGLKSPKDGGGISMHRQMYDKVGNLVDGAPNPPPHCIPPPPRYVMSGPFPQNTPSLVASLTESGTMSSMCLPSTTPASVSPQSSSISHHPHQFPATSLHQNDVTNCSSPPACAFSSELTLPLKAMGNYSDCKGGQNGGYSNARKFDSVAIDKCQDSPPHAQRYHSSHSAVGDIQNTTQQQPSLLESPMDSRRRRHDLHHFETTSNKDITVDHDINDSDGSKNIHDINGSDGNKNIHDIKESVHISTATSLSSHVPSSPKIQEQEHFFFDIRPSGRSDLRDGNHLTHDLPSLRIQSVHPPRSTSLRRLPVDRAPQTCHIDEGLARSPGDTNHRRPDTDQGRLGIDATTMDTEDLKSGVNMDNKSVRGDGPGDSVTPPLHYTPDDSSFQSNTTSKNDLPSNVGEDTSYSSINVMTRLEAGGGGSTSYGPSSPIPLSTSVDLSSRPTHRPPFSRPLPPPLSSSALSSVSCLSLGAATTLGPVSKASSGASVNKVSTRCLPPHPTTALPLHHTLSCGLSPAWRSSRLATTTDTGCVAFRGFGRTTEAEMIKSADSSFFPLPPLPHNQRQSVLNPAPRYSSPATTPSTAAAVKALELAVSMTRDALSKGSAIPNPSSVDRSRSCGGAVCVRNCSPNGDILRDNIQRDRRIRRKKRFDAPTGDSEWEGEDCPSPLSESDAGGDAEGLADRGTGSLSGETVEWEGETHKSRPANHPGNCFAGDELHTSTGRGKGDSGCRSGLNFDSRYPHPEDWKQKKELEDQIETMKAELRRAVSRAEEAEKRVVLLSSTPEAPKSVVDDEKISSRLSIKCDDNATSNKGREDVFASHLFLDCHQENHRTHGATQRPQSVPSYLFAPPPPPYRPSEGKIVGEGNEDIRSDGMASIHEDYTNLNKQRVENESSLLKNGRRVLPAPELLVDCAVQTDSYDSFDSQSDRFGDFCGSRASVPFLRSESSSNKYNEGVASVDVSRVTDKSSELVPKFLVKFSDLKDVIAEIERSSIDDTAGGGINVECVSDAKFLQDAREGGDDGGEGGEVDDFASLAVETLGNSGLDGSLMQKKQRYDLGQQRCQVHRACLDVLKQLHSIVERLNSPISNVASRVSSRHSPSSPPISTFSWHQNPPSPVTSLPPPSSKSWDGSTVGDSKQGGDGVEGSDSVNMCLRAQVAIKNANNGNGDRKGTLNLDEFLERGKCMRARAPDIARMTAGVKHNQSRESINVRSVSVKGMTDVMDVVARMQEIYKKTAELNNPNRQTSLSIRSQNREFLDSFQQRIEGSVRTFSQPPSPASHLSTSIPPPAPLQSRLKQSFSPAQESQLHSSSLEGNSSYDESTVRLFSAHSLSDSLFSPDVSAFPHGPSTTKSESTEKIVAGPDRYKKDCSPLGQNRAALPVASHQTEISEEQSLVEIESKGGLWRS